MDRRELADFLRSRRERIAPADVGLPAGRRRRTPGLRREEVAHLAYISTEYYTRLEQARGPHPSREVLAGLARALRLSDAERDHLHRLAGRSPAPPPGPPREVRQSILDLLRRLPQTTAAYVVSATYEVLAWNEPAAALLEDFSALARRDRNILRRVLLQPGADGRNRYGVSDADALARNAAHHLRAAASRYPGDPELAGLVADLLAGNEDFARQWASHDVAAQHTLRKTFRHPLVGPVTVNCDVLDISDRDQRLVIYTADPGSSAEEALRLLSVVGTEQMASAR